MERSSNGDLVTELILETFRLNGQLLEAGDRLTAPLGLSSARWQVLGAIEAEARPLTVAQIGRRMGLSRQAVQRLVNDLERLGFVSLEDMVGVSPAELEEVEGVGPKTAQSLLDWLASISETEAEAAPEEEAGEEAVEAAPALNEDEFMAALSKALRESEEQQASAAADGFDAFEAAEGSDEGSQEI